MNLKWQPQMPSLLREINLKNNVKCVVCSFHFPFHFIPINLVSKIRFVNIGLFFSFPRIQAHSFVRQQRRVARLCISIRSYQYLGWLQTQQVLRQILAFGKIAICCWYCCLSGCSYFAAINRCLWGKPAPAQPFALLPLSLSYTKTAREWAARNRSLV